MPFDAQAYKSSNIMARAFNWLKDWRAIGTRCSKEAEHFLAGVCLAAATSKRTSRNARS